MTVAEQTQVLRNAFWLALQRGIILVAGVAFAVLMPRLMGPPAYGRYTLLVSVATWFFVASDWGCVQVLIRYLPKRGVELGPEGMKALFNRILALRMLLGAAAAVLYLPAARRLLPDVPLAAMLFLSGTIALLAVSDPLYCLFLGRQQAARWGVGFVLRRLLVLAAVPAGYVAGGLVGAAAGGLAAELCVCGVGLVWSRRWLSRADFRPDLPHLRPYLRFGVVFFASAILHVSFRLGGEPLIRVIGHDYAQVAYYGIMIGIYTATEASVLQLFHAFTSYLALRVARGEHEQVGPWIERVLRALTALAVPGVLAAVFLHREVVVGLFGDRYLPAAPNLVPLSLALVALTAGTAANALAMVLERPGLSLEAAAVRFGAFGLLALALVPWQGAFGGAVAMATATGIYAAWIMIRVRRHVALPLRRWLLTLAAGVPPLALLALKGGSARNAALAAAAIALYAAILGAARILTPGEIRAAWRLFRGRPAAPAPAWQGTA